MVQAGSGTAPAVAYKNLYAIRVGEIWRFLRTQPASFWLVCVYLLIEYVRPQQVYESIAIFPWARSIIILCTVAFLLERGWFRFHRPVDVLVGVFTAAVLASSVFAYDPHESYAHLWMFLPFVLIYLLISNIVTTERRFLVFMLSFLLYNLKMSVHAVRSWAQDDFIFRDWGAVGSPGFFGNSGEFGIEMTIFIPLSLYFIMSLRRYWRPGKLLVFAVMPFTALVGAVASSSRGALLGAGAALLWMLAKSRRRVRGLVAVALVSAAVVLIVPPESKQRFANMGEDPTSVTRLTYWRRGIEMFKEYPVLGIGYGNWMSYYAHRYGAGGQVPHNIFVQAGSELGLAGLLGFVALIGATFVVNYRTRRLVRRLPDGQFTHAMAHGLDGALIGFLVSGFFVTVLYYPYFWINLAMTVALHNVARNQSRVAAGLAAERSRRSSSGALILGVTGRQAG